MKKKPLLVVMVGATAVGKTAMALDLAQSWGVPVISADSRQCYREMQIGTSKPAAEALRRVKHYFINSHSISEAYTAGAFAQDVARLLPQLFAQNDLQLMVGGSGLYIQAVCEGLDEMPPVEPQIRAALADAYAADGLEPLLQELRKKDPDYYAEVDQANVRRVVRALEVIRQTQKTYSSFRKHVPLRRDYDVLKVGLEIDRATLYERIEGRMEQMIAQGLFEEAERFYPLRNKQALQTIGYQEIFHYLEGLYDKKEAIRLLKRNSRRYAKRQITWFKKDAEVHWFHPSQRQELAELIRVTYPSST